MIVQELKGAEMTREEAKKIIYDQWQAFLENYIDYGGISEAYKMAIKALEQEPREITLEDVKGYCKPRCLTIISNELLHELTHPKIKALRQQPCEDCISRTQALEMLGDEPENWTDTEKEIQEVNDYRWFKSILEDLPSVTNCGIKMEGIANG